MDNSIFIERNYAVLLYWNFYNNQEHKRTASWEPSYCSSENPWSWQYGTEGFEEGYAERKRRKSQSDALFYASSIALDNLLLETLQNWIIGAWYTAMDIGQSIIGDFTELDYGRLVYSNGQSIIGDFTELDYLRLGLFPN